MHDPLGLQPSCPMSGQRRANAVRECAGSSNRPGNVVTPNHDGFTSIKSLLYDARAYGRHAAGVVHLGPRSSKLQGVHPVPLPATSVTTSITASERGRISLGRPSPPPLLLICRCRRLPIAIRDAGLLGLDPSLVRLSFDLRSTFVRRLPDLPSPRVERAADQVWTSFEAIAGRIAPLGTPNTRPRLPVPKGPKD